MQRRFQPTRGATLFTLAVFAVLVAMGVWQLKRLEWKTSVLTQITQQMKKPPVPLPENIDRPQDWEFRRVTLAGHFLYDHEFLVKPRVMDGINGFHMLVPFQRVSGGVVLVNRGWISSELLPKATRPKGLMQIEGIAQLPRRNYFTPQNVPQKNDWYWPDINAMAAAARLSKTLPVIVTVAKKQVGVYPMSGSVEVNIPNDHKQYAFFWFTMAAILQVIFFLRHWKPQRRQ